MISLPFQSLNKNQKQVIYFVYFFFFLCLLRQMEMQKECGVAEHNVHATPCGLCSRHYRAMSKLSKLICRILTTEGKANRNQCESLACACQLAKFCALECSLCRFFGLICVLACHAVRLVLPEARTLAEVARHKPAVHAACLVETAFFCLFDS